jgi:HD superfamily phosphohydrolase
LRLAACGLAGACLDGYPAASVLLRDPVHGLISFAPRDPSDSGDPHGLLVRLLDTREVQRLRRIRAMGLASLAYPGSEHSRFAHVVGSTHVMQRYLARVGSLAADLPEHERIDGYWAAVGMAAALLHDLGHGPLSHTFEGLHPEAPRHEHWTSRIVLDDQTEVHRVLAEFDPRAPRDVERLVHGECPIRHLARAVSGTFDVDRCDYLLRDSHMTGVRYGLLDLDWLLASLRLYLPAGASSATLAVDGAKGLTAVEGFFLARLYMYRQVYLHKAVRAAEVMVHAIFRRLRALHEHGGRVEGTPEPIAKLLRGEPISTSEYLELDDPGLDVALAGFARGRDHVLATLASGVRDRKLLKSIKLREGTSEAEVRDRIDSVVRAAGWDPEYFVILDHVTTAGYVEDEGLVVLSGARVQSLLDASSVLAGLAQQSFSSLRVMFPAALRAVVSHALEDLR